VLLELKTDRSSRNEKQDGYLRDAKDAGLPKLLQGVLNLFNATRAKRKYFHLLQLLEQLNLIKMDSGLLDAMQDNSAGNAQTLSRSTEILQDRDVDLEIVYLQPTPDAGNRQPSGTHVITFSEFATLVSNSPTSTVLDGQCSSWKSALTSSTLKWVGSKLPPIHSF
jgi:hypothetical protein